nr:hypothetical protein JVH1_5287 [Rhodococcus sp. JVH1]
MGPSRSSTRRRTSSVSAHGVAWSSLSPGTPQRLRQALESLADRLR